MTITVVITKSRWNQMKRKDKEMVTGIKFPRPSDGLGVKERDKLYHKMIAEEVFTQTNIE